MSRKNNKEQNKISQDRYYELLLRNFTEADKQRIEKAYEQAWKAKNFEIENYWKRTIYFWGFQTVIFAGFCTISAQKPIGEDRSLIFCIICVGFITALAWFLTNKGSKTWQENWENHVDMLEDYVTGPLYKIISKQSYSVSKINLEISRFIMFLWAIFMIRYLLQYTTFIPSNSNGIAYLEITCVILTIYITIQFFHKGKSSNNTPKAKEFFWRENIFKEKS